MRSCPDFLFSEGSTRTRESVLACAEVYRTQPCDEAIANIPPACATDGTLVPGSPCAFRSQCAGSCFTGDTAGCGECVANAELDGACGDDMGCPSSQVCEGFQCVDDPNTVDETGLPGAACLGYCITGYVCAKATPGGPNTCLPEPAFGAPCHYDGVDDGVDAGQCAIYTAYCDADFTCRPRPAQGEPCAPEIAGHLRCRYDICVNGTCPIIDNPGATCDASFGGTECEGLTTCRCPGEEIGCTQGTCVYEREEAEACAGPNDRCAVGTVCTDGVCLATDELTIAPQCL
jgi:hypothetical protein